MVSWRGRGKEGGRKKGSCGGKKRRKEKRHNSGGTREEKAHTGLASLLRMKKLPGIPAFPFTPKRQLAMFQQNILSRQTWQMFQT